MWDLLSTWRRPLDDDSAGALLQFYGPMFLVWMFTAFRVARDRRRFLPGAAAGTLVAFGTLCVFVVFNFVRVNLFLHELTARPDWQNMMKRFSDSGSGNLRLFVNLDYLKGTPFKIAFVTGVGAVLASVAACVGRLTRPSPIQTS
jgi:hypothetical protein